VSDPAAEIAAARRAALAWGGAAGVPRLIRARENRVFEVMLPAGRAALRLHRPGYQTAAAIGSELRWVAALAAEGLPVAAPLPTTGGEMLAQLDDGTRASAVRWVAGDPVGQGGAALVPGGAGARALHRDLGALIAALHAASDRFAPGPGFERPHWDGPGIAGEAPLWGRFWEHPALAPAEAARLAALRAPLQAAMARMAAHDRGLIHADLLRENILRGPEGLALIDFDDSGFGPRLYDLGTALVQSAPAEDLEARAEALIEGYARTRPVPADARALVLAATLARACASVGWTMPRLGPADPIHRSHIGRALALAERLGLG
jgi:Ser/Thr protein kinase RdoA (MazF antagonist)